MSLWTPSHKSNRISHSITGSMLQMGDMLVPHVEAVIMATDKVGLAVLQKAKCFDCYSTWHEAKMKGEIAASSAMLKANYNLDAFLPPYQNVNWQDKRAWPCAASHRPQQHQDPGSRAGLLTNIVEVSLLLCVNQQHGMTCSCKCCVWFTLADLCKHTLDSTWIKGRLLMAVKLSPVLYAGMAQLQMLHGSCHCTHRTRI